MASSFKPRTASYKIKTLSLLTKWEIDSLHKIARVAVGFIEVVAIRIVIDERSVVRACVRKCTYWTNVEYKR